jgi:capsular exopolysaccharide synthesis family protein
LGKITDALNKANQEKETQKQDLVKNQQEGKEIASSEKPEVVGRLPLEERLKNRIYIAKATDDSGIDPRIVTYFDPKSIISEQYRILRTNIQSNNLPKPLKTIVISSALHGEGKTVTAVNLAITMARDLDKTVLLVDCDLRAGIIHKLLAINPACGLSDILLNGTALELAFYKTRINNLTILPRGDIPHNPSELLGSKKTRRLLEELRAKFDYIILDSPPTIPLTDACVLSAQVDGVILVVQAHRTPRQVVEHAQNLLKHVHAKILGFVLTQTEPYIPKYMYRYRRYIQRDKSEINVT